LVTLVGCYFGTWQATKKWGCPQVLGAHWDEASVESPVPFVVVRTTLVIQNTKRGIRLDNDRTYYLWIFGFVTRLHGPEHRIPIEAIDPARLVIQR